jgi:SH3-like domain-containing protein
MLGVHAFLEASGDVYQCMPWTFRGQHVGNSSLNDTHIGVEMTEPAHLRYRIVNGVYQAEFTDPDPARTRVHLAGTYKTAVELFAKLCKDYGLNPLASDVIRSHGEIGGHYDPEHLWGKYGLTMNQFRRDVNTAMREITPPSGSMPSPPFTARVIADELNIRNGPGTNYAINGVIRDKGSYTIVEVSGGLGANDWGKLKSGAGWISLDSVFLNVVFTAPPPFSPYTVKLTINELNIRNGPGTNYAINGVIRDMGMYTIVEESNGPGASKWGRLKSGAGWISLDFTA